MEPVYQIAGVLFADIAGYSKLKEAQIKTYLSKVVPDLAARVIDPHRQHFLELNTWGDGLILASTDPYKLAEIALELRDFYRKRNWSADSLPKLKVRVSLHAGAVYVGDDLIRRTNGIIGTQVNLAARIEPIITVGEVWVSEQFFHLIPQDQELPFGFDELGEKELAKQFGTAKLYRLRWEFESPSKETAATGKDKEETVAGSSAPKGGGSSGVISVASLEAETHKISAKSGPPSIPPSTALSVHSAGPSVPGIAADGTTVYSLADDVSHPRNQADYRGELHRCRFHIISPKYLEKSRWSTLADVLVEVIASELPKEDWTREAYLIPSARALPKLRETLLLRQDPKLLKKKREATERFIKEWENRELQGSWFSMPTRLGKSVGIYCLAYDLFLNASVSGQI